MGGVEVKLYTFFNLAATWGLLVNATPRQLYPREMAPVPIVQEAGWDSGPAENLAPTGVRIPNRPAHSESLYRLSYPGRSKS